MTVSGTAPRTAPDRERRWLRSSQIATVVGVPLAIAGLVVGALALGSPDTPPPPPATSAATGPTGATTAPTSETTAPPTTGAPGARRFLTELEPDSGGGTVQRTGPHSLVMKCGTGESDDRYREVSYLVPQVGYRSFATTLAAAGQRDSRLQVLLLVDSRVVTQALLPAGDTGRLSWSGQGAGRLTLRLVCEPGATAATFGDPALARDS